MNGNEPTTDWVKVFAYAGIAIGAAVATYYGAVTLIPLLKGLGWVGLSSRFMVKPVTFSEDND